MGISISVLIHSWWVKVFSLSLFTSYQCDYLFLEILIFLEILELFNKKKEKKRKKKKCTGTKMLTSIQTYSKSLSYGTEVEEVRSLDLGKKIGLPFILCVQTEYLDLLLHILYACLLLLKTQLSGIMLRPWSQQHIACFMREFQCI